MPTAAQVKALVHSHADGDEQRFYTIAIQVAAEAARQGHVRFAQELRDLIDRSRAAATNTIRPRPQPVPVVQPRGELAGLLTAGYPKTRLSDLALDASLKHRIERVLLEQRQGAQLRAHGLTPQRKLLLVGPPGTGKTMTAAVLAGELSLPLFSIQLHGLITKYLGETAAKLHLIFDAIKETRAVYLFDEFDALGADRASRNEVGEIRRVLNSFLQFLEQDESESLVVAATNHPALLDRALLRRFDTVLKYTLPSAIVAKEVLQSRLAILKAVELDWKQVSKAAKGLSHAELTRACEQAAKDAVLARRMTINSAELVSALKQRRSANA